MLQGNQTGMIKKFYPLDLSPFYRVKVHPMEKSGLRLTQTQQYQNSPGAKMEPYDIWISIFEDKIKVRQNNNLFDFADKIDIEQNTYEIKGLVRETFGNRPVIHVFLLKETEK